MENRRLSFIFTNFKSSKTEDEKCLKISQNPGFLEIKNSRKNVEMLKTYLKIPFILTATFLKENEICYNFQKLKDQET